MSALRIGTRKSALAAWQAEKVRAALLGAHPGLEIEIVGMTTVRDRDHLKSAAEPDGTGVFTKEIEEALLDGRTDLEVHSLKDLPTDIHNGLALAAIPPREDPADALIARNGMTLAGLPKEAVALPQYQEDANYSPIRIALRERNFVRPALVGVKRDARVTLIRRL